MKFLIDADSPLSLLDIITKHEAAHVNNIFRTASDEEIFAYANKHNCIIITRDLGFADMFMKNKGFGLILMRLPYYFKSNKIINALDDFLNEINATDLIGAIVVIELGKYRIKNQTIAN